MNFDVKDVKSWSNRHDVKTLSVTGFFGNSLSEIDDEIKRYNNGEEDCLHELYMISDNGCFCFEYALYFADTGAFSGTNNFAFFLPLDAVKEDKPKKRYRPFKSLYEFYIFLSHSPIPKEEFNQNMLLGEVFTYREKKAPRYAHTVVINRIDFDLANEPCLPDIEGRNLGLWFDFSEIMNDDGDWQPFGVDVKDE